MVGAVIPAGTRGLFKATYSSTAGPGTYLTDQPPPTSEAADRRLYLGGQRPDEVREYGTVRDAYATVGPVWGSTTGALQFEFRDKEALELLGHQHLRSDLEVRLLNGLGGAALGAIAGLIAWLLTRRGGAKQVFTLAIVGFVAGFLFPTDLADLHALLFGIVSTVISLAP